MKRNLYLQQLLLIIGVCFVPALGFAQVYSNNFTGTSGCPTKGNVPTVATNAIGTPLTRSALMCTMTANVFNSSTINNTATINNSSYIEFSVTANAGYKLDLTSLSFFRQGSISAPNQLEIRYSTDAFATFTSWGAAPTTTTAPGAISTWDFPDFTTSEGATITFRIYPYGKQRADLASGNASASATIRLDNIVLNGSVIAPMPVKLISFTGDYDQNKIRLQWQTAWEEQNEGFEIQKSTDAVNFNKIGYLKGNTTTKSTSSYTFTDTEIQQQQTAYFRLKQIDLDGTFEYSRIISINTTFGDGDDLIAFPNPSHGIFTLKSKDINPLNFQLFNTVGGEIPIKVSAGEVAGSYLIMIDSSIIPEIYDLKISSDSNSKPKSIRIMID